MTQVEQGTGERNGSDRRYRIVRGSILFPIPGTLNPGKGMPPHLDSLLVLLFSLILLSPDVRKYEVRGHYS
jgi:hypothetical protein